MAILRLKSNHVDAFPGGTKTGVGTYNETIVAKRTHKNEIENLCQQNIVCRMGFYAVVMNALHFDIAKFFLKEIGESPCPFTVPPNNKYAHWPFLSLFILCYEILFQNTAYIYERQEKSRRLVVAGSG